MATVAVIGFALLNRIWLDIVLGAKNALYPEYRPGGFPWEATRQARALGFDVSVVTLLGDDHAGDFVYDAFRNTGADVRGIRRVSSHTPQAEVIVRGNERTILIDRAMHTALFSFTEVQRQLLAQADVWVAGGTLDRDRPDTVLTEVVRLARKCDKPLFLNPTRIHDVQAIDLRGVKMIVVSRGDFRHYGFAADAPAAAVAEALLERGAENVATTDSANPMRAYNLGESVTMFTLPVAEPRFPTGAGEVSFTGAVAGFLSGASTYEWLNIGAMAGAFFVEHGRPASWTEIAALDRVCPPEMRLASRDHSNGEVKPTRPATRNDRRSS